MLNKSYYNIEYFQQLPCTYTYYMYIDLNIFLYISLISNRVLLKLNVIADTIFLSSHRLHHCWLCISDFSAKRLLNIEPRNLRNKIIPRRKIIKRHCCCILHKSNVIYLCGIICFINMSPFIATVNAKTITSKSNFTITY